MFSLYYTKVKLGSPPREFTVQIDTGSDILWVTCSSCSDCPQLSGLGVNFGLVCDFSFNRLNFIELRGKFVLQLLILFNNYVVD